MTSTTVGLYHDADLDRLARLGKWLALAESKATSPEARGASAALRFYYAEHLGLPPMAAAELNVIDGKLVVSALLLRALAEQRGYRVERDEASNATSCTAELYRGANLLGTSTFTIEQAKQAGLAGKTNWRTYPDRMLWARASTNVIRDYVPAVAVGIVTAEEFADRDVVDGDAYGVTSDEVDWPSDQRDLYDAEQELAAREAGERGEQGDPPDDAAD
jgi:hypothetical protein